MLLVLIIAAIGGTQIFAQKSTNKGKKAKKEQKKGTDKSISEVVKPCRQYDGLFTLYQDTVTGIAYLLVKKSQLNKEFIYFSFVADGVRKAGHFRGSYKGSRIFSIQKYFNKIEFILENTGFFYDEENALSKSKEANINRPVIISEEIVGINDKKDEYLIKADAVFLKESFRQIKRSPNPKDKGKSIFSIGKLNESKNKYISIKSYPANTDVLVEYIYENPYPLKYGDKTITDARFISVKIQHSLIAVPQNDFKSRFDDPRIGYFTHQITDMTSASATPYRDVIHRWNLVKQDKNAAISDPIEPIVWWIENTTPVELREHIKAAVLNWNIAFEAAGFENAIVVKIQPDDAQWDAGDIRYNVLRWTSSPMAAFGGYGPSFVNPRTGQILGADIMLEFLFLTNRLRYDKIFTSAGFGLTEQADKFDEDYCLIGNHMHSNTLFGSYASGEKYLPGGKLSTMVKEAIYYLMLHEMGHTLGLNHNMKASQLHSPKDINHRDLTMQTGLTGSVMDYPTINFALNKKDQGQYYDIKPGPYDIWAVKFGYSETLDDPNAEKERLQKILERSTDPKLAFGNDADDMRSPGRGIDPRIMINDMSNDAITYSIDRIKLINKILPKIKEKYTIDGQSFHELRNAYLVLTGQYGIALRVISRYIGGIYLDRSFAGQKELPTPFTPVGYEEQKRAMKTLSNYAFGIDAFKFPEDIYTLLQMQRRGFNHLGKSEDPKIHDRTLFMQKNILDHLLHRNVLKRIINTKLYGNRYSLAEFIKDLTNAIFKDDLNTSVNSFRQNLQIEYINRLVKIIQSKDKDAYDHISKSMALYHLKQIEKMQLTARSPDDSTKAHRQHILFLIEKAIKQQ